MQFAFFFVDVLNGDYATGDFSVEVENGNGGEADP